MTQDLRLAVHRFPGDRPVLLVHGFTRSAALDWIEPGWPAALAAQGRGAVAVDLPGHGSCPAADPGRVSVGAVVAALVTVIDGTGQERADVIGNPWAPGWPGPWPRPAGSAGWCSAA